MNDIEDVLRAAVHDLAREAPRGHDLAAAARAQGSRLRRRRRVALAAAVVALIAATATPYVLLRRTAPEPQPITPVPTVTSVPGLWWQSPYRLPGGAVVTALSKIGVGISGAPARTTVHDGNVLLDPDTGHYVVLPSDYYTIYGAPGGGRAYADNGEGGAGIVDAKNGRGVWWDGKGGDPQWSADGGEVLTTDGDNGFVIIDAATGKVLAHHTVSDLDCPDDCFYTWLPGDREVAIARRDPAVPHDEAKPDVVKDVEIYSIATGERVRTVPVPGAPAGPDAWSSDGSLVLVSDRTEPGTERIVGVTDGKVVGTIAGGNCHFLPDGRILAVDDEQAVLYDDRGHALVTQALPKEFRAREISVDVG